MGIDTMKFLDFLKQSLDTMKFLDFLKKSFLTLCIGLCLGGCGFAVYHRHYDSAFTWGIALVYAIGWRLEVSATSTSEATLKKVNEMVEIARNKVVELEKKLVEARGNAENGSETGK